MKIYYVLLPFLIFSCTSEKGSSDDILPKNKMVDILIDVHLVESAISVKNLAKDSSEILYKLYEKEILKKHKVSEPEYKRSTLYYTQDAKLMDQIYEVVVDSLSLREAQKKL